MDIAEIINSANTAFEEVKKISAVTEDANAIMSCITGFASQLGELKKAILVGDVQQLYRGYVGKKDKKTATQRALELYTAKVRINEMEKELYNMFLYGDLSHLGIEGYREFCKIREDIENGSIKEAEIENTYEIAKEADERFIKQMKIAIGALFGSIVAVVQLAQQIKDLFE